MQARDLNFDTIRSIDLNTESKPTAFSTYYGGCVRRYRHCRVADYGRYRMGADALNKVLKGKDR